MIEKINLRICANSKCRSNKKPAGQFSNYPAGFFIFPAAQRYGASRLSGNKLGKSQS